MTAVRGKESLLQIVDSLVFIFSTRAAFRHQGHYSGQHGDDVDTVLPDVCFRLFLLCNLLLLAQLLLLTENLGDEHNER